MSEVCLICVYGPAIARSGFKYDQAPWSFLEGVTFNDSNPGGIGSPTENSARKREQLSYQATVGIDFRVVKDVPCLIRCPPWALVTAELTKALIDGGYYVYHAYVAYFRAAAVLILPVRQQTAVRRSRAGAEVRNLSVVCEMPRFYAISVHHEEGIAFQDTIRPAGRPRVIVGQKPAVGRPSV